VCVGKFGRRGDCVKPKPLCSLSYFPRKMSDVESDIVLGLAVDPINPVNRETLTLISYYLAS